MALFGTKKNKETKTAKSANASRAQAKDAVAYAGSTNLSHVILRPRITEKATMHSEQGVYAFDVADGANKPQIMQAIRSLYKVTPRKVRVVVFPSKIKRSARTGKRGVKSGGKKAYVYLKRGETINLS